MSRLLTIAHLTFIEARRRRVVYAAVLCGLAFLLVYGAAVYFVSRYAGPAPRRMPPAQVRAQLEFLVLAGLYVVNFLGIAAAVLLSIDTLSGEIASGVMQTLAAKPVRRAEILLGKWLTYWLLTAAYVVLMTWGIVLLVQLLTGFAQPRLVRALPLMVLGATIMLTVTMAGGVRLTTITNGIVAFSFYGLAFIGGWVEQIGAIARNDAARDIGTVISLVSPSDAMWRRAAYELQPPFMRDLQLTPFASFSVPSGAMIGWTVGLIVVVLGSALIAFRRRAL